MSDTPEPNSPQEPIAPSAGSSLPYFLALAVLFVMAYGAWKWYQVRQFEFDRGQAITAAIGPPLTEFQLTERSGEPFRSTDMRGKVWVVTYFFASCPGSCLRLNQNIKLLNELPELGDVTWVSITVDPDNDSLDVLRDYAERWDADPQRWLFCRADLDYIMRIGQGMHLDVYRQGHKDYAVVIDKTGKIRGMYDATSKSQSERLRTKLLECLAEPYPRELAATAVNKTAG
jgi:protein SCO1/2